MKPSTILVIGDGAWGTALALVLLGNGHRVRLWGPFPDALDLLRKDHENKAFLPGVPLPGDLDITADRTAATAGIDAAVLAVPTRYFRDTIAGFRDCLPATCRLISVAKGLDRTTHQRMTEVAAGTLEGRSVAALSGPSHAEEVARSIPTAVTVAAVNPDDARFFQDLFSAGRFRVYTSTDIRGVELGGALKNVIAVAVGVSDGLGFGDNTRAALIARGLAEMTRLGCALGARASTFSGLSGMGDLIVTCTSRHSRNRGFGERIGRGESASDILASTHQAVEGAWNCEAARDLARQTGVEVPITDQVYAMVHEQRRPELAVECLLNRESKPESD
ncbi:MAG: glycerol-3-phosphate dehydrogenase [Lentisphaerae bacterium RIFOXYC12_FULL_60_16]|nr:MAG: glycerol-3-phosphate dehydrogenase [Lentisphaerae bacterium RIFOXYC12_FULL_60_16]OGV86890.1 MAG: glycerol-3-phosphate dehydrogenase [Lentisphaerae bacterium RIFOXYB12_FULL_60_10]